MIEDLCLLQPLVRGGVCWVIHSVIPKVPSSVARGAVPGISQPPTEAPAVHPWITGPVAETARAMIGKMGLEPERRKIQDLSLVCLVVVMVNGG